MKYHKLRVFDTLIEASFAKDKLLNAGVPCFLANETVTTLLPTLNFIHGGGIHLMVNQEDFVEAERILMTDESGKAPDVSEL